MLAEVWENVRKQLQGKEFNTQQRYMTTGILHLIGQKVFGW